MTRILLLNGHPDPDPDRFVHGALRRYAQGAEGRHDLRELAIGKIDFPLIRTRGQWQDGTVPEVIAQAKDSILWAEHVVIAYPLWLGDVPALLKGFFEQVFRPGFAFDDAQKGRWSAKRLSGRSARIIVTMGMPAPIYRLWFRSHSLKSLERNMLGFVGFGPVRHTIVGMVESSLAHREKWLARIERLGEKGR